MGSAAPGWEFFALMAFGFILPFVADYLSVKIKGNR